MLLFCQKNIHPGRGMGRPCGHEECPRGLDKGIDADHLDSLPTFHEDFDTRMLSNSSDGARDIANSSQGWYIACPCYDPEVPEDENLSMRYALMMTKEFLDADNLIER